MARPAGWADDLDAALRTRLKAGERFTIEQAYECIPDLMKKRPDAKNVEARVRDALQQLKHKGKAEFLEKGHYRLKR
jgi:hypothetical protein